MKHLSTEQQKPIGHYKSHRGVTQAPIGNIVYETNDDDNQSNYHLDVTNIDDDDDDENGSNSDDERQGTDKYSQFDAGNNDNNDGAEFNNQHQQRQNQHKQKQKPQKQQQQHKVLKTIIDLKDVDDDIDSAQANGKQERQRYSVVYPSATGNLMQRPTEMTHKNWGKWKIEISFA